MRTTSKLNSLIGSVETALNGYDPACTGRVIDSFVNDDLSNWYIRLNRKRLWGKETSAGKHLTHHTPCTCLVVVSKLLVPFAPSYTDRLYPDPGGKAESVRLEHLPATDERLVNEDLGARMSLAQKTTNMVLALRRGTNIKARQPSMQIMIPVIGEGQRRRISTTVDSIK